MNETILDVRGVNIYYGTQHAVQDVSFSIAKGEIFGLLGPNGAGKTSTLSMIEGLRAPVSGTIYIAGHDIRENPANAKANMGVQLQSTSFQSDLTIREIIDLYAGLYGLSLSRQSIDERLREIQLDDARNKRFGQLSGGQQQRVSLLIATIHDPMLALLDEPTTGLDPQARRQLWSRIDRMKEAGKAVLLTTHSMEEAEAVCDRIAIIDHGKIIATDTPEGLIQAYATDERVKAVSRNSRVTLEDVFIGLTGSALRG
ncbi:MAG TPA: ABC transporter ATP-binding protein [Candidatus Paceibacterota bacterium]|nr:ABC transporter ATP-binding protein [Candidatus Paceibacterota bacterium]